MLSTDANEFGVSEAPNHKWLIGDYEAGDAVFHHSCAFAPNCQRRRD